MFTWILRVFFGVEWQWDEKEIDNFDKEISAQVPLESGGDF